ncbi:MAG: DUF1837 domain-containing protein [Nitrospira sp.]|nr:DUF1837 domain-containing protein [Nitrospira sp.]
MSLYKNKPEPFLDLVVHDTTCRPGITGACAGYDGGKFRNDELATYMFDWLPEFALKYSELEEFNSGTAMRLVKQAAKTVYTTDKYQKRGEFGELLLHALVRQVFNSEPAISKIYYKSAMNETVKGFDAVHIVEDGDNLELWLGEVKFYNGNGNRAITDLVNEIIDHTQREYLKDEFILIGTKLDPNWKHTPKLRQLISGRTPLDQVFTRICIPALFTYESDSVAAHTQETTAFKLALEAEILALHSNMASANLPAVRVHLFIVPLHKKQDLLKILHEKLEGMQR